MGGLRPGTNCQRIPFIYVTASKSYKNFTYKWPFWIYVSKKYFMFLILPFTPLPTNIRVTIRAIFPQTRPGQNCRGVLQHLFTAYVVLTFQLKNILKLTSIAPNTYNHCRFIRLSWFWLMSSSVTYAVNKCNLLHLQTWYCTVCHYVPTPIDYG